MKNRLALSAATLLAACQATMPDDWKTEGDIEGVKYWMKEHASDGAHTVPVDRPFEVDRHSKLELRFDAGATVGQDAPSPEWTAVNKWLESYQRFADSLIRLNALVVDPNDKDAVANLRIQVGTHDALRRALVNEAKESISKVLTPDQLRELELGQGPWANRGGSRGDRFRMWMLEKRNQLVLEGNSRRLSAEENQIAVLAFRKKDGRIIDRLHVENYDNIASGNDKEQKRGVLGLSPEDLSRLKMEIEQSQRAAAALKDIRSRGDKIKGQLVELLTRLRAEAEKIGATVRKFADARESAIGELIVFLDAKKPQFASDADKTRAIGKLIGEAGKLQKLWDDGKALTAKARAILDLGAAKRLDQILFGAAGVLANLGQLKTDLDALLIHAKAVADSPKVILAEVQKLAFTGDDKTKWEALVPASLLDAVAGLIKELEPVIAVAKHLADRVSGGQQDFESVEAVSDSGDATIARSLDDLLPARIDLGEVVEPGDGVLVRIEYRKSTGTTKTRDYDLDVERIGWWPQVTGEAILARAKSGGPGSTTWQPNVAVLATWHYRTRNPNGWGEFMNWLDPAFGLHAASLDQGPENVEFGLGASLRLWDGLLFVGYGYNLQVSDDHDYVFVGTSLFKLLGYVSGNEK